MRAHIEAYRTTDKRSGSCGFVSTAFFFFSSLKKCQDSRSSVSPVVALTSATLWGSEKKGRTTLQLRQ